MEGRAEGMPLRVMWMSWGGDGASGAPRDGGSSRIQQCLSIHIAAGDCSLSEGRANGVISQLACEVLISLLIISTNFLPFRDVQNKPRLSRSVLPLKASTQAKPLLEIKEAVLSL